MVIDRWPSQTWIALVPLVVERVCGTSVRWLCFREEPRDCGCPPATSEELLCPSPISFGPPQ
jgi:hypothetical protein